MDIIAIKGIRPESLRRFSRDWWAVRGKIKKSRGWLFLFVVGTDYWGTITQYAQLISSEMRKLAIHIDGQSGIVNQFTIYEDGIVCPPSKMPQKHECWLIENRLSRWKVNERDQENLRKLLYEFSEDTSGPIIYLDTSNTKLSRLAGALFDSWKLPPVWSIDSIDDMAEDKDCEVI